MRIVTAAVFALGLLIPLGSSGEDKVPNLKIGDRVVVSMKGDFSKKYQGIMDSYSDTNRFVIKGGQTRVAAVLKNERYRVESKVEIQEEGKSFYLVTYSAVIHASELKPSIVASGDVLEDIIVSEDVKSAPRIELSDLGTVQLRCWKLDQEILK